MTSQLIARLTATTGNRGLELLEDVRHWGWLRTPERRAAHHDGG
jgi:hypothetical protein